jgi:hypothetical protein
VDPDYTVTVGLDRDQARALVADADIGARALRTAAVVRLLLHNALCVDQACATGVGWLLEDLREIVVGDAVATLLAPRPCQPGQPQPAASRP